MSEINSKENKFENISQFYPFYLSQHANNMNRLLHFIGTTLATIHLLLFFYLLTPINLVMGILLGYGFAWVGHFFFERNKPATFKYPVMSFLCDYLMYWDIITFKIGRRLKEYSIQNIKYIQTDLF